MYRGRLLKESSPERNLLKAKHVIEDIESRLGKKLPATYLCFDLETTGFNFDWRLSGASNDLIVDVGVCLNGDGGFFENKILNWLSGHHDVCKHWLSKKFEDCKTSMARSGKVYPFTVETIASGENPEFVLEWTQQQLQKSIDSCGFVFGFNIMSFDRDVFADATAEFLGKEYYMGDELLFDVGLIEKAAQANIAMGVESLASYFFRIKKSYSKVKWNLDTCVERYNLRKHYDLNSISTHNASSDAMLTHILFEEMRR